MSDQTATLPAPAPKPVNWELAAKAAAEQRNRTLQAYYDLDIQLTLANAEIAALEAKVAELTPKVGPPPAP